MSLPTLIKTWQFDVNNVGGISAGNQQDHQRTLFAIKDAMVSFGTKPWTVSSSSNATSAGASDYWSTWTDLNWSTGSHSWIVLKAPGDVGYEICIDLNIATTVEDNISMYWSPGGNYAGDGTTSSRPSCSDEQPLRSSNSWFGRQVSAAFNSKVHVLHSSDGNVTTVIGFLSGLCVCFWRFEVVADKVSGWTDGVWIKILGSTDPYDTLDFTYFPHTSTVYGVSYGEESGSVFWIRPSYECLETTEEAWMEWQTVPSDWTGAWGMGAMGLWSKDTGYRGKIGNAADLYWGSHTRHIGDQFPAPPDTPLYQFAQVGQSIIIPWDSTSVIEIA